MIALNNHSKSTLNYKHFALALLVACTPLTVQQSYAQLQLEIAKAPEQAPQIAVVPFGNDQTVSPIVASDLMEDYARKIYFFPDSGQVLVKRIRKFNNSTIMDRESAYRIKLKQGPEQSEFEQFD